MLDVCAGLTAAGSPFDFLQEPTALPLHSATFCSEAQAAGRVRLIYPHSEAAVTHMQQTAEDSLGSEVLLLDLL